MNLARQLLEDRGDTLEDWDGVCGEVADQVIREYGGEIIWVGGDLIWEDKHWSHHMVARVDGLIHDAWCAGDALPLTEWLAKMFQDTDVNVAENGVDIYDGPADQFYYYAKSDT